MFVFKEKIYLTALGSNNELKRNGDGTEPFSLLESQIDKTLFPDPAIRLRMSRLIRMGVTAAMDCLQQQPDRRPDAILMATGVGCLANTEKYMENVTDNYQDLLNPPSFIQPTLRIVGEQIALITGNPCYNNTYVHRAFSLESALQQAALLITDKKAKHVLVGVVDELPSATMALFARLGIWKDREPGEGAAFFMVSGEPGKENCGQLVGVDIFYGKHVEQEVRHQILNTLWKNKIDGAFVATPEDYKQLCGKSFTALSFPVWGVAKRIQEKEYTVPVVIYNTFLDNHALVILTP